MGRGPVVKKWQAIDYVNRQIGQSLLSGQNTYFASKSKHSGGEHVWWLNIPLDRASTNLHLLLKLAVKDDAGGLIWLKLPANTLSVQRFSCRTINDTKKIEIEIGAQGADYLKEIRSHGAGHDFSPHIERQFNSTS